MEARTETGPFPVPTKYDLSHLIQPLNQDVLGPIQDDEALLLYALCKVMQIRTVVELGTQNGYSANNFLRAILPHGGHIISIDVNDFPARAEGFTFIKKNVSGVSVEDIPWEIDLVFFDTHDGISQVRFYERMVEGNKITDNTILVIHDTGLHPIDIGGARKVGKGYAHQPVERQFVNWLIDRGWMPLHTHTELDRHSEVLPYRHGLTILNKKKYLEE